MFLPANQFQLKHIKICGNILKKKKSIYNYPCNSEDLLEWIVTKRNKKTIICKINEIQKKVMTVDLSKPNKEEIYVLGLLHM